MRRTAATHSAQPGAKYAQVLLAAAVAAYKFGDALGYFQPSSLVEPMTTILGRPEEIAGLISIFHNSQKPSEARSWIVLADPGAYRFRFAHPLLPPYVIMRSIRDKIVTAEVVNLLLAD